MIVTLAHYDLTDTNMTTILQYLHRICDTTSLIALQNLDPTQSQSATLYDIMTKATFQH